MHKKMNVDVMPVLTPDIGVKKQNGRRIKDENEEMFTLTRNDIHGVAFKVKSATSDGYEVCRGVSIQSIYHSRTAQQEEEESEGG